MKNTRIRSIGILTLCCVMLLLQGCGKSVPPSAPGSGSSTPAAGASSPGIGSTSSVPDPVGGTTTPSSSGKSPSPVSGKTSDLPGAVEDTTDAADITFPLPGLVNHYECEYDAPDSREVIAYASYCTLALDTKSAAEYPRLDKALKQAAEKSDATYAENLEEIAQFARHDREYDVYFNEYYIEHEAVIARSDEELLSTTECYFDFSGGIHGMYAIYGRAYDAKTGDELLLTDFIREDSHDAFSKLVTAALKDDLEEWDISARFVEEYLVENLRDNPETVQFSVYPNGICVFFTPYEIGPYAAGALPAYILYKGNEGVFTSRFKESAGSYGTQLMEGITYQYNEDGNGRYDTVYVSSYENEYSYSTVRVELNGEETILDSLYFYEMSYTLVKMDDGSFVLYVMGTSDNDYRGIAGFKLDGDELTPFGEIYGYVSGIFDEAAFHEAPLLDPDSFILVENTDVMGTGFVYDEKYIDSDGQAKSRDGVFEFLSERELTAIADIPCTLLNDDGTFGKDSTVRKGESVYILRYTVEGEEKIVYCRAEDGTGFALTVVYNKAEYDYTGKIGGVPITELFEYIVFAG